MLKIGSAYKIKRAIHDAFIGNTNFGNFNDGLSKGLHNDKIFTVLGSLEASKDNFYYPHHRYKILLENKIFSFIFMNNGAFSKNIPHYLEEIIDEDDRKI